MPEGLDRYVRVVFADDTGAAYEVDQTFHISFSVEGSKKRDPDTAEVRIFNLKKDLRHFIGTLATTIEVFAGRTTPAPSIFKGEIIDGESSRSFDFIDWETEIDAEDTKSKMRTRIVSRTYSAGTMLHAALRDLAAAAEAQIDIHVTDKALPDSMSFLARPRDCLAKLVDRFGLRYQIRNQRIVVSNSDDAIVTAQVPLINASTGLIGVPTVKREKGVVKVSFQTMLNPALLPGGLCHLETNAVESGRRANLNPSATYWINRRTHYGDTQPGGDFYTECEVQEI